MNDIKIAKVVVQTEVDVVDFTATTERSLTQITNNKGICGPQIWREAASDYEIFLVKFVMNVGGRWYLLLLKWH